MLPRRRSLARWKRRRPPGRRSARRPQLRRRLRSASRSMVPGNRRSSREHLVVEVVEGGFVDELRRRRVRRALLLLLRLPAPGAPLLGHHAKIERAHLPLPLVVRAQRLEDAVLGGDHRLAGAAELVPELVELLQLDLRAEHLEPALFELPGDDLEAIGHQPRDRSEDRRVRLQLAPGHLGAHLPAQRPGEVRLLHQLKLEQVGPQPPAIQHLPVERFLEPVRGQVSCQDQDLADLRHPDPQPSTAPGGANAGAPS